MSSSKTSSPSHQCFIISLCNSFDLVARSTIIKLRERRESFVCIIRSFSSSPRDVSSARLVGANLSFTCRQRRTIPSLWAQKANDFLSQLCHRRAPTSDDKKLSTRSHHHHPLSHSSELIFISNVCLSPRANQLRLRASLRSSPISYLIFKLKLISWFLSIAIKPLALSWAFAAFTFSPANRLSSSTTLSFPHNNSMRFVFIFWVNLLLFSISRLSTSMSLSLTPSRAGESSCSRNIKQHRRQRQKSNLRSIILITMTFDDRLSFDIFFFRYRSAGGWGEANWNRRGGRGRSRLGANDLIMRSPKTNSNKWHCNVGDDFEIPKISLSLSLLPANSVTSRTRLSSRDCSEAFGPFRHHE